MWLSSLLCCEATHAQLVHTFTKAVWAHSPLLVLGLRVNLLYGGEANLVSVHVLNVIVI